MKSQNVIPVDIVKKAQNGNTEAMEVLLLKSDRIIRLTARRFTHHFFLMQELDDICQEIKLKIIKNLKKLNSKTYSNWIRITTRNFCIDLLRKKKPLLLKDEEEEKLNRISDIKILEKNSLQEFKDFEIYFENKQRIRKIFQEMKPQDIALFNNYFGSNVTLEKFASTQSGLKKSSWSNKIKLAVARARIVNANIDIQEFNFDDAENKLELFFSLKFSPHDSSREKRFLYASATSRRGCISLIKGEGIAANFYFEISALIFEELNDKENLLDTIYKMNFSYDEWIRWNNGTYRSLAKVLHNLPTKPK